MLVAIDMGYGHLRAASALGSVLGTSVLEADRAPLADAGEQRSWRRARSFYETVSRGTGLPFVGPAFRRALDSITDIPKLRGDDDLKAPTAAVRMLGRMAERGLGRGLVEALGASGCPLLTTFYAPAVIAAGAGLPGVTCVVTDADVNRVWVPEDPIASAIRYCVPTERTAVRLRRYGVPADRIERTGFPLPAELTGGDDLSTLRSNLSARLGRLDRSGAFRRANAEALRLQGFDAAVSRVADPPRIALLVGGAGAQVAEAVEALAALGEGITRGRWRVTLVAGTRTEVADVFRVESERLGLSRHGGLEILHAPDFATYYARINETLARTDVVWTKPSEMTFYAALGLPLLLAEPLGVHERCNRRYVLARGAAFDARSADRLLTRLSHGLRSGALATAAWNGFRTMPKHGTSKILAAVAQSS